MSMTECYSMAFAKKYIIFRVLIVVGGGVKGVGAGRGVKSDLIKSEGTSLRICIPAGIVSLQLD